MSAASEPTRLLTVPTELDASHLVAVLEDAGIEAWVEGGITSGFRAEAPGGAHVYVREDQLDEARLIVQPDAPLQDRVCRSPRCFRKVIWMIVAVMIVAWILFSVVSGNRLW